MNFAERRRFRFLPLLSIMFIVLVSSVAEGQTNSEVFGQNRIQKRKFKWKFFDTHHFRVYHYDNAGRQLGRYVSEEAESDIAVIEKKLGGQFPQRFNIILYNSYDEYRQSNVGLKEESPTLGNTRAGAVKIVDDKLVVYFTGEHADLRRQIRSGMALVVMQRMIFGESLKTMVKNALLLNLPPWVTDGYIAYLVDGWDAKSSSEWKGILDARPGEGFYELAERYPELAGKAFWKYVSTKYSMKVVKSLLYSMQQKTSLNKAMLEPYNLRMKVTDAYDSCISFYKNTYATDALSQEEPDSTHGLISLKVPKDNSVIRNIKISPSGTDVCYVAWKDGLYTVYTQKTTGSQTITNLLEGGEKDMTEQIDPNYPMVAWSKTGNKLAVLYRGKKGATLLRIYNNEKGRIENHVIPSNRFDRVLSFAFMQDDDNLVLSAIKNSQTDLYMFKIRGSRMTNITDDAWDDVSPEFVSGGSRTGILFLSNRPQPNLNVPVGVNELPAGPLNVFFYNTVSERPELLQCSDVKEGHISQPVQYGPENFAYLHDKNGVNNKYVVMFARDENNLDTPYAEPVTNYRSGIISHQYTSVTGDIADVVQQKDKYVVYFHELLLPENGLPVKKLQRTTLSMEQPEPVGLIEKKSTNSPFANRRRNSSQSGTSSIPEIKSGNVFQSEFSDNDAPTKNVFASGAEPSIGEDEENDDADSSLLTEMTDSAYLKMRPQKYRHSFKPDFLSVKLNNSILFNQYQSIAANGGDYQNPSVSALTNISLNEVLENHRITAGFQFPLENANSTYFLQYQNFTHRLDWGLLYLRKQDKAYKGVGYVDNNNNLIFVKQQLFKTTTNLIQADFSYPIDRMRSLRFHTSVREDRFVQKVTDTLSLALDFPKTFTYTSFSRFEYVFDNTISPVLNILNGTRYKVFTEYIYGLNEGNKSCYNFGFDFRHYEKLYKNIILANMVSYAHSDGNSKVQYLAGGVDNWIRPKKSTSGGGSLDGYGFQRLATPLRGYKQSARAGNNYAVVSTEVRVPVVTTFVKRPIQSAILKNLQLVPFADAGATWRGFVPDAERLTESFHFPNYGVNGGLNNVNLDLTRFSGIALGYGAGLRTSLFGYFLRLDAAWNIEGGRRPLIYLALGTDF